MSRHDPPTDAERPHDVLAAEEFALGTADPALHVEPPHDVLAAEEFGMGTGDPTLRHDPLILPEEPPGAPAEPHDVLAAEEFAVPAGHPVPVGAAVAVGAADEAAPRRRTRAFAVVAALAGAAVALLVRRRH
jgi:hypothetical protein